MRKHAAVIGLGFAALAAFALFLGWAFFKASVAADGWRSLGPIWPYVLGGAIAVGALIGFFLWLAVYAARHGYEDVER